MTITNCLELDLNLISVDLISSDDISIKTRFDLHLFICIDFLLFLLHYLSMSRYFLLFILEFFHLIHLLNGLHQLLINLFQFLNSWIFICWLLWIYHFQLINPIYQIPIDLIDLLILFLQISVHHFTLIEFEHYILKLFLLVFDNHLQIVDLLSQLPFIFQIPIGFGHFLQLSFFLLLFQTYCSRN